MVGRTRARPARGRGPPPARPPPRPSSCGGVSVKGDRGHLALARRRPHRPQRRAGRAWPACPATGSGSCTRWPWACARRPADRCWWRASSCSRAAPGPALAAGAVGIPEDPVADSVVPGLTIAEHMALGDLKVPRKGLGIDWAAVKKRLAHPGRGDPAAHGRLPPPGGQPVGRQHPAGPAHPGAGPGVDPRGRRLPQPGPRRGHHPPHPGAAARAAGGGGRGAR